MCHVADTHARTLGYRAHAVFTRANLAASFRIIHPPLTPPASLMAIAVPSVIELKDVAKRLAVIQYADVAKRLAMIEHDDVANGLAVIKHDDVAKGLR